MPKTIGCNSADERSENSSSAEPKVHECSSMSKLDRGTSLLDVATTHDSTGGPLARMSMTASISSISETACKIRRCLATTESGGRGQ